MPAAYSAELHARIIMFYSIWWREQSLMIPFFFHSFKFVQTRQSLPWPLLLPTHSPIALATKASIIRAANYFHIPPLLRLPNQLVLLPPLIVLWTTSGHPARS